MKCSFRTVQAVRSIPVVKTGQSLSAITIYPPTCKSQEGTRNYPYQTFQFNNANIPKNRPYFKPSIRRNDNLERYFPRDLHKLCQITDTLAQRQRDHLEIASNATEDTEEQMKRLGDIRL